MSFALALVLGLGLSLFLPLGLLTMMALGLVAGCIGTMADLAFSRELPTYIPPLNRPRPVTAQGQIAGAIICVVVGLLLIAVALLVSLPGPFWEPWGAYLGAMLLGSSLGQMLTAAKMREHHNAWLASMNPQNSLDLDS
jgi:hypothetical protein